jgi:hypothetical protein
LGNGVKPPFNQRRPQFIAEFWTYTKMRKPWVYVQVVSVTLNNFFIFLSESYSKNISLVIKVFKNMTARSSGKNHLLSPVYIFVTNYRLF